MRYTESEKMRMPLRCGREGGWTVKPKEIRWRGSAPLQAQQAALRCAACAVGYLLARQLLGGLSRGLLAAWLQGPGAGAPPALWQTLQWGAALACGAAALLVPVWAAGRFLPERPGLRLARPRGNALRWMLPAYLAAAQACSLLAGAIGRMTGSARRIVLPEAGGALALAFLTLCVMPALLEELLFRGLMQGLLRSQGALFAIVGQAALFALLHGDLSGILFALPAGLVFGLLAEQSESILPGMLIHFVNNALAFAALWLQSRAYDGLVAAFSAACLAGFPVWAAAAVVRQRRRGPLLRPMEAGESPLLLSGCPAWLLVTAVLLLSAVLDAFWIR